MLTTINMLLVQFIDLSDETITNDYLSNKQFTPKDNNIADVNILKLSSTISSQQSPNRNNDTIDINKTMNANHKSIITSDHLNSVASVTNFESTVVINEKSASNANYTEAVANHEKAKTSIASSRETNKPASIASYNEINKPASIASYRETNKPGSIASYNEVNKSDSIASYIDTNKLGYIASYREVNKPASIASYNEINKPDSIVNYSNDEVNLKKATTSIASNNKVDENFTGASKETITWDLNHRGSLMNHKENADNSSIQSSSIQSISTLTTKQTSRGGFDAFSKQNSNISSFKDTNTIDKSIKSESSQSIKKRSSSRISIPFLSAFSSQKLKSKHFDDNDDEIYTFEHAKNIDETYSDYIKLKSIDKINVLLGWQV